MPRVGPANHGRTGLKHMTLAPLRRAQARHITYVRGRYWRYRKSLHSRRIRNIVRPPLQQGPAKTEAGGGRCQVADCEQDVLCRCRGSVWGLKTDDQVGPCRPGSVPGQRGAAGGVPRGRGAVRGRRPQGLGAGGLARAGTGSRSSIVDRVYGFKKGIARRRSSGHGILLDRAALRLVGVGLEERSTTHRSASSGNGYTITPLLRKARFRGTL